MIILVNDKQNNKTNFQYMLILLNLFVLFLIRSKTLNAN